MRIIIKSILLGKDTINQTFSENGFLANNRALAYGVISPRRDNI